MSSKDRYCAGTICRHRALVEYFGQKYSSPSCNACDVCLGEMQPVPDALVVAQKIVSCVYRLRQSFGAGHVISVLRGENTERIRERNHDQLSTYGLMRGHSRNELRDLVYQLVSQGYLRQTDDEYPVLQLTEGSRLVMRGEAEVRLRQPIVAKKKDLAKPRRSSVDGGEYDTGLFDALRKWRRSEAERRRVPPYVIFSDRTLREVARVQPTTLTALRGIYGVGDAKLEQFGNDVVAVVAQFKA